MASLLHNIVAQDDSEGNVEFTDSNDNQFSSYMPDYSPCYIDIIKSTSILCTLDIMIPQISSAISHKNYHRNKFSCMHHSGVVKQFNDLTGASIILKKH